MLYDMCAIIKGGPTNDTKSVANENLLLLRLCSAVENSLNVCQWIQRRWWLLRQTHKNIVMEPTDSVQHAIHTDMRRSFWALCLCAIRNALWCWTNAKWLPIAQRIINHSEKIPIQSPICHIEPEWWITIQIRYPTEMHCPRKITLYITFNLQ